MTERERLRELIRKAKRQEYIDALTADIDTAIDMPRGEEYLADYLLANGVVVVDTNIVSPKNRPLISQCLGRPIDEIIELVNAKDEGRILVLHCKLEDTVYVIYFGKRIIETKATSITLDLREDGVLWYCCDGGYYFDNSAIGRHVFFSREEAEKALAERSKK